MHRKEVCEDGAEINEHMNKRENTIGVDQSLRNRVGGQEGQEGRIVLSHRSDDAVGVAHAVINRPAGGLVGLGQGETPLHPPSFGFRQFLPLFVAVR